MKHVRSNVKLVNVS